MKDGLIGYSKITSNKHISIPKKVQEALGDVEEGRDKACGMICHSIGFG